MFRNAIVISVLLLSVSGVGAEPYYPGAPSPYERERHDFLDVQQESFRGHGVSGPADTSTERRQNRQNVSTPSTFVPPSPWLNDRPVP